MNGMVIQTTDGETGETVYLKLAMRLALEYLKEIPKEKRGSYMIGPGAEKITYPDAVGVVESFVDAI